MAVAEKFKMFNQAKEFIGDGTIDLDAGDAYFAWILVLSAYTEDLTDSTYADVSANEHANGNGYLTGGIPAVGTAWTHAAGTVTFDCTTDPTWTAASGSIVARRIMLVHVAAGSGDPQSTDKLICTCLMDSAPDDITVTDTNTLTVQLNGSGIFTMSGGTAA